MIEHEGACEREALSFATVRRLVAAGCLAPVVATNRPARESRLNE
jgi:hypothetical protein